MKSLRMRPRYLSLLTGLVLLLPCCKKPEDIKLPAGKPELELFDATFDSTGSGARSVRLKVVHLYADTVYLLNQPFSRESGEQLIIEPGTLIKVKSSGSPVGQIQINPGGIITAAGTQAKPIVFTSSDKTGTQASNWDGLVIRGRSYNNARGNTGIADDFSGVLQYVRIEFAPLVLDAVGNKTLIENVMVSYTNKAVFDQYQSAFSFYGGTFSARKLISYACGGPADFFITNGYQGNLQNLIACRHPYFGKIGLEPDNSLSGVFIQNSSAFNAPTATPYTNPIISNLTVLGPNRIAGMPAAYADTISRSGALITTRSTCFQIRNSLLLGYSSSGWYLDDKVVADNLQKRVVVDFNYSIVHCNNNSRLFYLAPGTAGNLNSVDFRNYVLGAGFSNRNISDLTALGFTDIATFDDGPDLQPVANSPLLSGANYSGAVYSNAFFDKNASYLGALGKDDWTRGWTNFTPLKTKYNSPG